MGKMCKQVCLPIRIVSGVLALIDVSCCLLCCHVCRFISKGHNHTYADGAHAEMAADILKVVNSPVPELCFGLAGACH